MAAITSSSLSRRQLLCYGAAAPAMCASGEAKAFDPLTLGIIALLVAGTTLTLASLAKQDAWQDRQPADLAKLPPFGQPQEIVPERRDGQIDLTDGGRIVCPDGSLHAIPPGSTALAPHSDLTISEALICGATAPYAEDLRIAPSADPDLSKRRLEDLGRVWDTPMKRMRYTRPMRDARGNRYLLISAVARACPQTELLTLCAASGAHWRPVERLVAEPWTVHGARDFA